MDKIMQKYIDLANECNGLKNDTDRYIFLKEHNEKFEVELDNDCSSIRFIDRDIEEYLQEKHNIDLNGFDDYHGRNNGNIELFRFAGIKADAC